MKFFTDLERKYQKYAIRNLMYYITILYAVGLIIWLLDPMIYYNYLSLNVGMILRGQIWRLRRNVPCIRKCSECHEP